jgi:hypothetical protein
MLKTALRILIRAVGYGSFALVMASLSIVAHSEGIGEGGINGMFETAYLRLSGGNMTGNINLNQPNRIVFDDDLDTYCAADNGDDKLRCTVGGSLATEVRSSGFKVLNSISSLTVETTNGILLSGSNNHLNFSGESSSPPSVSFDDGATLWVEENGGGKEELKVIFDSGSAIVLATEP